jgi:hypothetical protein
MTDKIPEEHPHTHYKKEHGEKPYWKRAHHDWKFWVALFFLLFAMWIYIRSNDLSVRPNGHTQQPVP